MDMNQVVKRVLEVLREAVEENKAEIELDPLPTVIAEESQMAQVIQNLVSNAIKFRGKESPRIRITATAGSGEWIFSVSDNGIGLSMEYADRIFQMFQRLHTRDEYPGTGVGLAIVKKIVERHGGRICVESEVGKGATFIFTIPVDQNEGMPNLIPHRKIVDAGKYHHQSEHRAKPSSRLPMMDNSSPTEAVFPKTIPFSIGWPGPPSVLCTDNQAGRVLS